MSATHVLPINSALGDSTLAETTETTATTTTTTSTSTTTTVRVDLAINNLSCAKQRIEHTLDMISSRAGSSPNSIRCQTVRQVPSASFRGNSFFVSFGELNPTVEGLINGSLDYDILAGLLFCKINNIDVLLSKELISINGKLIPYESRPECIQHIIFRTESMVLRND